MDIFKKNKFITLLAVIAVLALAYFAFSSFAASPTLSSTDATDSQSQTLLVTLSNLHTIRLNGAIFSDPTFVSLTDFGVVIAPETPGRRNPFAAASGGTQSPSSNSIKPPALH